MASVDRACLDLEGSIPAEGVDSKSDGSKGICFRFETADLDFPSPMHVLDVLLGGMWIDADADEDVDSIFEVSIS